MKFNLTLMICLLGSSVFAQTNILPTSGNVGIGTVTPSEKLSVLGNISSSVHANEGGTLFLENTLKTAPDVAKRWALYNMTGSYGNSLQFWSYNHEVTSYGPKFSLSDNGNVGVGTVTPSSKLEVLGQVTSYNVGFGQLNGGSSTKNYANFTSNNHGSVLVSSNLFMDGNDDLKIAKSHQTLAGAAILLPGNSMPNQGGITFYTKSASTVSAEQNYSGLASMVILPIGDVGIGTTTPKEKLSVNGKIRAHEIKVETSNWPDYVFKDGYELTSLSELEKYILNNGHLPEMPTSKEAEINGVELGEMNKLLLKKVEELTLYLIEKDKTLKKQIAINENQNERLIRVEALLVNVFGKSKNLN